MSNVSINNNIFNPELLNHDKLNDFINKYKGCLIIHNTYKKGFVVELTVENLIDNIRDEYIIEHESIKSMGFLYLPNSHTLIDKEGNVILDNIKFVQPVSDKAKLYWEWEKENVDFTYVDTFN